MSAPFMPNRFDDGGNLDLEKVNDSLKKLARDIKKNQDARYTYSRHKFLLDGVTNASAQALLQYAIRRPNSNAAVEIVGVEIYIAAADTQTWTLACSDTTWPSISVVDSNDATVFASATSGVPVSVTSAFTDLTFTLSCSGASTITRGILVVHTRCDRGNQGDAFTGYTPSLLSSTSSTAGSVLDTELLNAETAVNCDTNANKDVRVECFVVRNLAAGSSQTWRIPSTGRRKMAAISYNVQAGGGTMSVTLDGSSIGVVSGAGATSRAEVTTALVGSQTGTDPTNSANDTILTITANTNPVLLGFVLLFWS